MFTSGSTVAGRKTTKRNIRTIRKGSSLGTCKKFFGKNSISPRFLYTNPLVKVVCELKPLYVYWFYGVVPIMLHSAHPVVPLLAFPPNFW